MNLQQKINDYVRIILNKFKRTSTDSLEINETLSRLDTITKNQIWYRGDSYEIKQMFSQCSDYFGSNAFWLKAPNSHKVACRHYPMPQIIVDTLTSICTALPSCGLSFTISSRICGMPRCSSRSAGAPGSSRRKPARPPGSAYGSGSTAAD